MDNSDEPKQEQGKPANRTIAILLIYHCISFIFIGLAFAFGKGGPCNPGMDLLAGFLAFVIDIVLIVFSLLKIVKTKGHGKMLLINLLAIVVLFLMGAVF